MAAPLSFRRLELLFAPAVLAACLLATGASARQGGPGADAAAPAPTSPRGGPDLKVIYVTVTDAKRGLVTGLGPESFEVYDGGRPARVASFSAADEPASISILLDGSGSVGQGAAGETLGARRVRDGLLRFLRGCHAASEFSLTVFNHRQHLVLEKTGDPAALLAALDAYGSKRPRGLTALNDALYYAAALSERGRHPKRAVLVVSDGKDTASRYRPEEVEKALAESDLLVYAVHLHNPYDQLSESNAAWSALARLAEVSGGAAFRAGNERELYAAMERVAEELRGQYKLAVELAPPKKGGWHELKVRVSVQPAAGGKAPALKARARKGFYTPQPDAHARRRQ